MARHTQMNTKILIHLHIPTYGPLENEQKTLYVE